jgi:hypothetical protein
VAAEPAIDECGVDIELAGTFGLELVRLELDDNAAR